MKKIIATLAIAFLAIALNAQQRFNDGIYENQPIKVGKAYKTNTKFKYTYPLDFGIGVSHLKMKEPYTNTWNGYSAPSSFFMYETVLCGVYFSFGSSTKHLPYDVLGYTIRTYGDYMRIGLELGKFYWYNNKSVQSLSIAPFYGTGGCGLSDCSGNTVGWDTKQIDRFRQEVKHYGVKLAYTYNFLELGVIVSKNEISISIMGVLDATKAFFM